MLRSIEQTPVLFPFFFLWVATFALYPAARVSEVSVQVAARGCEILHPIQPWRTAEQPCVCRCPEQKLHSLTYFQKLSAYSAREATLKLLLSS